MRRGAEEQRGAHGTTWFVFASHKMHRFRGRSCEITPRRGRGGPSRSPHMVRRSLAPVAGW